MLWYALVLVVHFLGLIALFGYFILHARAGSRLRAAADVREAAAWLDVLATARPMLSGGAAMLLASGIVLAGMRWRASYPFTAVGMLTVLVVWVAGVIVSGRQLKAMRAMIAAAASGTSPRIGDALREAPGWATMMALNGAVMGVLIVMTVKPSWSWSVGLVLAASIIAGIAMMRAVRLAPR